MNKLFEGSNDNFFLKNYWILIFLFCHSLFFSCKNSTHQKDTYKYFFTGHAYQWGAPNWARLDYRLEKIPFKEYDQLWLGGDLCERVPHHPNTIQYLDTLLDFGSDSTHWAVGNHDVLNLDADYSLIESKTGRKTYYTKIVNGICLMILNTTETLQNVSHLVILHHHALLTNSIAENKINVQEIFNFYDPTFNIGCRIRGTFEELVYPRLVEVQKRGVQVILVGGDTGQQVKEFDFTSKDGIVFLGSGINNSYNNKGKAPDYFVFDPDQVLIFSHEKNQKKLTWEFVELNSLVE